jgi:amino acid adenylation domain-containing protein
VRCIESSSSSHSTETSSGHKTMTTALTNYLEAGRAKEPRQFQTIHKLFESQAERSGQAVALAYEDEHMTYQALNERANQVAHHLRRLGVGPEVLVGIYVDRSIELIVAILGVLKAGGAYVPLDPAYPKERLSYILEDSKATVMLTQSSLLEQLPESDATLICLDPGNSDLDCEMTDNPSSGAVEQSPAYVIYTSGSTGRPKGVVVTHQNVIRLFDQTEDWFNFNEEDVWTLFHSSAFDFSVWEIWGALLYGGKLVVVPYWITRSPEAFYDLLCAERVTVLNQTPSAFRQLIRAEETLSDVANVLTLNLVIFGGEALDLKSLKPWLERHPDTSPMLVNMYGITETTVHVTYRPLALEDVIGSQASLIGGPIPDLQLFLLDSDLQPVPVGVPGEMYVGGGGLARGYLNRPELTAERFIPNPFSQEPGDRLYKTGDLARYLQDGDIEYLGRVDNQVKIRGYRIELGEIESFLTSHPSVREAVVTLREDERGDKQLVGYVVPNTVDTSSQIEGAQADGAQASLNTDQIAQWEKVFDETYSLAPSDVDPFFNITGWNSSFTGQPIPAEEMREWVEATVSRILALRPARALEIGCGTGLLLSRLAPFCNQYTATDFSTVALDHIKQCLPASGHDFSHVKLLQRAADDFEGVEPFDTMILNSVAQYFPSIDYLLSVLERTVDAIEPGGRIFVGDLRSLSLLEAFHASVQLFRAHSSLSKAQLQQRTQTRMAEDEELVIDPAFFFALKHHLPRISHVEIRLKRGRAHNELTQFRYDVVLYIDGHTYQTADHPWSDWQEEGFTLEKLRRVLAEDSPQMLGVTRVPNGRLMKALRLTELLADSKGPQSTGEIIETLDSHDAGVGVDPEDICTICEEHGYTADLLKSDCGSDRYYDVVIRKREQADTAPVMLSAYRSAEQPTIKAWERYANNPLRVRTMRALVPQLRAFLQDVLPRYMVPGAFVIMQSLPLTAHGKIDRRALPAPDHARSEAEGSFLAPRSPVEEVLASIWTDVLGLDRVSVLDNFFDLGGHSLLATQVISRVRESFQIDIPLRRLFEAPSVAGLAESIEAAMRQDQGPQLPPIERASRDEVLPLSFAQQRLWFLDRLEPGNPAYNIALAVRLTGRLDVEALERSFGEMIRRHEVLRTVITEIDGSVSQRIQPVAPFKLEISDLSDLPESEREEELNRQSADEARQSFDLKRGPLLRAKVIRLSEQEHVAVVSMHHIVSDGWSTGVIVREICRLYEAYSRGRQSPLKDLEVQYADYAKWQRDWLQGEALETQLKYWKRLLSSGAHVLELPTDRPRPLIKDYKGAKRRVALSEELSERLRELSRREGVTLFMTLVAAFKTLLMKYTGEPEISIGTPIANRNRVQIESLIGFFVNTLVLRTDLSGDPSFKEAVRRVKEITLGAYAHQDLPFEKLVEELNPERHLNHTPLFQVMFALQNAPRETLELSGLKASAAGLEIGTAKFDITVSLADSGKAVIGEFEYNSNLFDASTIDRMIAQFNTLLEGVAADPQRPLSMLPLETDPQQHRLLVEWNDNRTAYPKDVCIHELFEEQAKRTPNAIALVLEDEQLTYGDLNRRANRLSRRLRAAGVEPEMRVGLCLERSMEMVVGLLAILKAGGAYLPLDPAYPAERLAYMLNDAQVKVLVTEQRQLSRLPADTAVKAICIDSSFDDDDAGEAAFITASKVTAENLAYVIYTSGSTGKPKGVCVTHRVAVSHFTSVQKEFDNGLAYTYLGLSSRDRVLQFASISFDVSLEQILPPLLNGATLILRGAELWSPQEFPEKVKRFGLTVVNLPASYWHQLAQDQAACAELAANKQLRTIIIGGDAMSSESVRLWQQTSKRAVRLVNAYGPTEAAITSAAFEVPPQFCEGQSVRRIPIGRPLANRELYILDGQGAPVPVAVRGELHIGGPALARCYLDRPALTAEKFIPNPFSDEPGARLYRTGDMARYLPDGSIEFLGRLDDQVKLRGFRVEPGEIEAILGQHPEVKAAAVVVREDSQGEKRLIAYTVVSERVVSEQRDSAATELRDFLRGMLPDFMVPSAFVILDAMPMTVSGKIDRNSLPSLAEARSPFEKTYVPPRTPVEEMLATIWSEALEQERIGINDNFFEAGGHSLLATKVVSRIEKSFHVNLPLRALFEAPTIADLAIEIGKRQLEQEDGDEIRQMMSQMEQLSDEEIQSMLVDAGSVIESLEASTARLAQHNGLAQNNGNGNKIADTALFIGDRSIWSEMAAEFVKEHLREVEVILYDRGDKYPAAVDSWEGDWIFSFKSDLILPRHILDRARKSALNFHPAAPQYRGVGGYSFALYNGDSSYGVTCHHMVERVDFGEIIQVKHFPILKHERASMLKARAASYCLTLFYEIVQLIIDGKELPQSEEAWGKRLYTYETLAKLKNEILSNGDRFNCIN